MEKEVLNRKMNTARNILLSCIGTKGVYADPSRYRYQCWTRDFVIAILPALISSGIGYIATAHLENLSRLQRNSGQIPILFLDRAWPFIRDKILRSWQSKKLSFMLRRFFSGQLWNLTPGTRDSEILYIIGMFEYAKGTGDDSLLKRYASNIEKALSYVETSLVTSDGLVIGCDWRDTMERSLGDLALLSNNALLYHAYDLLGEVAKSSRLRARINEAFWTGETYLDYRGNPRFDPLGGAFAVLYGVVPEERYPAVAEGFRSVDTAHGITIRCRHNPVSEEERSVIDRTDGVVVWPFVVGFSILAMLKMGMRETALEQFEKLLALDGFREWYDPATGKGYGADEQLWSAVLLLRAIHALKGT